MRSESKPTSGNDDLEATIPNPVLQRTPLADLLNRSSAVTQPSQPSEIVIGSLRSIESDGRPTVEWPAGPGLISPATSLVALAPVDLGRSVALCFPTGSTEPLILGFVWKPEARPLEVEVDGRQLAIEADESITLRCGQASITLTADGQVLLRGTYVSSHSSGTQRIKGAAVRIN